MAQSLELDQPDLNSSNQTENNHPPADLTQASQPHPLSTRSKTVGQPNTSKHNNNTAKPHSRKTEKVTKVSTKDPQPMAPTGSDAVPIPSIPIKLQPSKLFLHKCHKELDSLLESIKKDYHEEFKLLYNNETHGDLFIVIKELKKPLHKCIVSSRAHRLYCALRAFSVETVTIEKDTILNEPEFKPQQFGDKTTITKDQISLGQPIGLDQNFLRCTLPEEVITSELFLNLARRLYLDQDVKAEEEKLYKNIVDWLKLNKPELVRQSKKPDNTNSLRTLQPEHPSLSDNKNSTGTTTPRVTDSPDEPKSPVMSSNFHATSNEDIESVSDGVDSSSQASKPKEDGLNHSILTRAETFELISKSSNQDSSSAATPSNNTLLDFDDDSAVKEDSSPFVPTTRTGLKPKQFTSPTCQDIRDAMRSKDKPAIKNKESTSSSKNSSKTSTTAAVRRSSSQSSSTSSKITESHNNRTLLATKTSATAPLNVKTKATVIPRAHPISLERSQSPGTNVIKGSGRNFIAANKRMISQIEKKNQSQQISNQGTDSDQDLSESSLYLIEPLTTENMTIHMDKYTLTSRSKLAEALAQLFIEGKMVDVVLKVKDGKTVRAHLCILSARSPYLSEIIGKKVLADPWCENSKHEIEIDLCDFSLNTVNFSLMHIYSGAARVPEDIDLEELTRLSHLLHVSTLNQVCIHNLKMNFCHYFHKPCNVCSSGVLKTLPLAWRYDYSELYAKCLQWIGSHFASIFCLKEFSELKPHDLVEECYNATLSQLTPDNIIPKTIECQRLLKNLPRVKWTESIICLVGRQLEDFCHYVATNYERILQSESFLNLSKNCWECEILEENLLAAMNHLKPDIGCKTLIQLHKIECSIESSASANASDSFGNLVSKMRKYCERYLLKDAAAVVHCSSWRQMSPTLQKKIKDQAIISTDFDEPNRQLISKPKLPSMSRLGQKSTSPTLQISDRSSESPRSSSNRSTPESRLKSPSTTYLPPPKNKTAAARHVKILK